MELLQFYYSPQEKAETVHTFPNPKLLVDRLFDYTSEDRPDRP